MAPEFWRGGSAGGAPIGWAPLACTVEGAGCTADRASGKLEYGRASCVGIFESCPYAFSARPLGGSAGTRGANLIP